MKQILPLIIVAFILQGCIKDSAGTLTFYTKSTYDWHLLINDKDYGKIPWLPVEPTCNMSGMMNISLPVGNYTYDAKSMNGFAWGHKTNVSITSGECKVIKLP